MTLVGCWKCHNPMFADATWPRGVARKCDKCGSLVMRPNEAEITANALQRKAFMKHRKNLRRRQLAQHGK